MSFNEKFDLHGAWRREFALRLKRLSEWLKDHQLLNAAVEERLLRLETQVRSDKVMVAFVAEFSRGKSELINAIFFAAYGRRIMPVGAGRTTICPTELGYDAEVPPCLRLLPIETRLKTQALMEWRLVPEKWTHVDLDVNDPVQLAQALEKVAEVRRVTRDEARALGFWQDASQLDAQLKERRRNFGRRIEAIERIQQAATGRDERIDEIDGHERALDELDSKLDELTAQLVAAPVHKEDAAPAAQVAAMTQAA